MKSQTSVKTKDHRGKGVIRIIAGDWRGRRLPVVDAEGLRPTSDRVRETLFNWLMPYIAGSHCLDLFAGTGALGFEACSRGAKFVDFVESNRQVANGVEGNIAVLSAQAAIHNVAAEVYLKRDIKTHYDLVFVDPPFSGDSVEDVLTRLEIADCVAKGTLVYVEAGIEQGYTPPVNWQLLREKTTKQVCFCLFIVN